MSFKKHAVNFLLVRKRLNVGVHIKFAEIIILKRNINEAIARLFRVKEM